MQRCSRHLILKLLAIGIAFTMAACSASPGAINKAPAGAKPGTTSPAQSEDNQDIQAGAGANENFHCTETDPHPVGQNIAETYDVTYEEVMTWFCSGYSFDDILIALETSEATETQAADLLAMSETMSWEEIWVEVGFTPQ